MCGSRRLYAQHETMEDIYKGYIWNIKKCYIIVLLVDGDPHVYPLWVAKVIKVIE